MIDWTGLNHVETQRLAVLKIDTSGKNTQLAITVYQPLDKPRKTEYIIYSTNTSCSM